MQISRLLVLQLSCLLTALTNSGVCWAQLTNPPRDSIVDALMEGFSSSLASGKDAATDEKIGNYFTKMSELSSGIHTGRNLQEFPCNVPYLTMSAAEIQLTLSTVFQGKVAMGIEDAIIMVQKYIPLIEHDVQFVRVSQIQFCLSLSSCSCTILLQQAAIS
jgi:hypothetical protein